MADASPQPLTDQTRRRHRRLYESTDFPGESFTVADVRTVTGAADANVYACAVKGVPIGGFVFTVAGNVEPKDHADKPPTPAGTWHKATPARKSAKVEGEARGHVWNSSAEAMECLPINGMRIQACDGPDGGQA